VRLPSTACPPASLWPALPARLPTTHPGCPPHFYAAPAEFSIRLTNDDLPYLRETLRGITDDQYRKLLEGVVKYKNAFSWRADVGGRAFDYTIASLRRKHMNLKALFVPIYDEPPATAASTA